MPLQSIYARPDSGFFDEDNRKYENACRQLYAALTVEYFLPDLETVTSVSSPAFNISGCHHLLAYTPGSCPDKGAMLCRLLGGDHILTLRWVRNGGELSILHLSIDFTASPTYGGGERILNGIERAARHWIEVRFMPDYRADWDFRENDQSLLRAASGFNRP